MKVKLICPICGTRFERDKARVENVFGKINYCSRICAVKGNRSRTNFRII